MDFNITETCLRTLLAEEGYELNKPRRNGQTGVDIIATKGDERLQIEVIGFKSSPPARSKDFYEVFFRPTPASRFARFLLGPVKTRRFGATKIMPARKTEDR